MWLLWWLRENHKLEEPRGLHGPVTMGLEDIFEGRKRNRLRVSKKLNSLQFTSISCQGMKDTAGCPVIAKYWQTITTSYGVITDAYAILHLFPQHYLPVRYCFLTLSPPHSHCFPSKKCDYQSEIPERGKERLLFSKFEIHTLADRNCKHCLILISLFKSARYSAWKVKVLR